MTSHILGEFKINITDKWQKKFPHFEGGYLGVGEWMEGLKEGEYGQCTLHTYWTMKPVVIGLSRGQKDEGERWWGERI
jgi:hypothetical protein